MHLIIWEIVGDFGQRIGFFSKGFKGIFSRALAYRLLRAVLKKTLWLGKD